MDALRLDEAIADIPLSLALLRWWHLCLLLSRRLSTLKFRRYRLLRISSFQTGSPGITNIIFFALSDDGGTGQLRYHLIEGGAAK